MKLCNDLADVQQPPDFRHFRNVQDATEFYSHIGTTGRFCQVAEAIHAARMQLGWRSRLVLARS